MIYPLVIDPNFLKKIIDDEESFEKLKEFLLINQHLLYEIFILVDDENGNLFESYKKIWAEETYKNPEAKIKIEAILKFNKFQKITNIKTNENNSKNNKYYHNIVDKLEEKKVKNIIKFPDYFANKFIKNEKRKRFLYTMKNKNDLLDNFIAVTQFSKNINLIDPLIFFHITNVNDRGNMNFVSKIKLKKDEIIENLKKNKTTSDYMYYKTFEEIIKSIYDNNFFQDEVKINFFTSIAAGKMKDYERNIIQNSLKLIRFSSARQKGEDFFLYGPRNKEKNYNTLEINGKRISLLKKNELESIEEFENRVNKSKILSAFELDFIKNEINIWNTFPEKVKSLINEFMNDIVKLDKNIFNVNVKKHDTSIVNKNSSNEKVVEKIDDSYLRGICCEDIGAYIEVRKGFDLIDPTNKVNGLNKHRKYWVELLADEYEKKALSYTKAQPEAKLKEIYKIRDYVEIY
jgi:hypothetical protein